MADLLPLTCARSRSVNNQLPNCLYPVIRVYGVRKLDWMVQAGGWNNALAFQRGVGRMLDRSRRCLGMVVMLALATGCDVSQRPSTADSATATAVPAATAVAAEADLTSGPFPVTRVVDGDTLWVKRDGQNIKLRLIGIDTPETHDPRKPVQCFGEQASAQAATMLDGQLVLLETLLPSTENADQQSPRMPMILPRR